MGCGIARFGQWVYKLPKVENLGSGFCTQGPRMAAHMVLRMTARRDHKWRRTVRCHLRSLRRHLRSFCTVIRDTMCAAIQAPWGQNVGPKLSSLGFLDPSDQSELYHTQLLSKTRPE